MAVGVKKVRRTARERRKIRIRKIVSGTAERPRLTVFKSNKFTYAQIISDTSGQTLVSASSRDADVVSAAQSAATEGRSKSSKSITSAYALGKVLAQKASAKNVKAVVFDRNGFLYHGRIKAIADGAREGGLNF